MTRRTVLRALGALVVLGALARSPAAQARYASDVDVPDAAAKNDFDGVQKALIDGNSASITDNQGIPALIYAAKFDNAEMTRLLLDHGADITGRDPLGDMAIHWAAQRGSTNVLPILLDAKSPVDAGNRDGLTPLMLAARYGKTAAARILLDHGADPRKQDFTGRDALGWASQPAVRHLLEEKAK